MLYADKYLERFFSHFPEASGLEQFGTPDVHQYKTWRENEGNISSFKIMQEIKALERFFRYLIDHQKLPLSNPAKPFVKHINLKHIVRRKKDSLRLEEYQRLLEVCIEHEPRLIHWLVWMIQGIGSHDRHMSPQKAGRLLKKVSALAGMPFITMPHVKRSLRHGLWREIIKDWANRVLRDKGYIQAKDTRFKHIELPGDPFGTIKIPSSYEGAAICDPSEDPLLGGGISNQQDTPKPECP